MSKTKLKTPAPPSVLICTPCMSHVPVEFLTSAVTLDPTPGGRLSYLSGSLVHKARNDMVVNAVKGNFEYICWIDSDMTFPTDLVWKLLEDMKGRDYVSGLYFKRAFPLEPVVYKDMEWEEIPTGGVRCGCEPYWDYPQDSIFEIAGSGLGCCMMRTQILLDVVERFKLAPFNPMQGFGEDVSLNWRLREMGVKMYCDSRIKCGHIGWVVFNERMYKHPGNGDTDVKD